jgi:hypothetical protein
MSWVVLGTDGTTDVRAASGYVRNRIATGQPANSMNRPCGTGGTKHICVHNASQFVDCGKVQPSNREIESDGTSN